MELCPVRNKDVNTMEIEESKFDKNMKQLHTRFDEMLELLKAKNRLNGEIILDNQDLCIMFNLTTRSLQRYRTSGRLPFIRIGGKLFYYESEVQRFIKEREENKSKDEDETSVIL